MKEEISKITSTLLWETKAIKISIDKPFKLVSKNLSPIYINCRTLISHQVAREIIIAFAYWIYEKEKLHANYIAGGETAGIPYASWLADKLNKPLIYVRKESKSHGLLDQIEGYLKPKETVLLIEDLITDGRSKLTFIGGIRKAKGEIRNCLVIFDREQGGKKILAKHKVNLHSLTTLSLSLKIGIQSGFISSNEYQEVTDYISNPERWHIKRGLQFR